MMFGGDRRVSSYEDRPDKETDFDIIENNKGHATEFIPALAG
jgi:glycine/D-amino acid oxidase-like deaminating enzyme